MRELRIKEKMTRAEKAEHGEKHRIEYAYGAVFNDPKTAKPILLKSEDFWMPLGRAKKIHAWLGKAIKECARAKALAKTRRPRA